MNQKELEEQFRKCIEDLRPVIGDLSKTYPLEIIENSLLEVALRSLMLRYGLEGALTVFAGCVMGMTKAAPIIEKFDEDIETELSKMRMTPSDTIH
tara:strand:- start:114 stop:401 length:288 start_codon:yes stop_codon:yes gene_type:complete